MRDYGRVFGGRVYKEPRTPRPVKKGDVILSSMPFAHAISYNYLSMYCDTCVAPLRETILQPCEGCRVVWYCSAECRKESQAWHRLECLLLRRKKHNLPNTFVRLLARVIFRLREGGDRYVEKYWEKGARRFRDLMNHYADLKTREDLKPEIDETLNDLRLYIGERILPNESDLLGIYGRTLVNCFSFVDSMMLNIGCAVYLAASIFDHDCSPTGFATFSGLNVEVRSLVDMPDLDLAKCRISYTDPVSTSAARRETLFKGWFFLCECKTCLDQERAKYENSIKCETPQCEGIISLPEASDTIHQIKLKIKASAEREEKRKEKEKEAEGRRKWRREERKKVSADEGNQKDQESEGKGEERKEEKIPGCDVCGWNPSSDKVKQYWDTVVVIKNKMKAMENNMNIEYCFQIMEKLTDFSPMNAWRVKTLDFLFNSAILNSCWSLALKYGEENRDGMRFYYSSNNPVFSLFLFNLGKANIYLKEFREGLRILEEAEILLKTAMGSSHPIVEELYQLTLLANEDREICLERLSIAAKKQEEKRQLCEIHSSGDKTLVNIFATLSQLSRSPPQNTSGV